MLIHSRANARSLAFRGICACLLCLVFYMASGLSTTVEASTTSIKKEEVNQPLYNSDKKQQTVIAETEEGGPAAAVPVDLEADDGSRLNVASAFIRAMAEGDIRQLMLLSTPTFQTEILKAMEVTEMEIDQIEATPDLRWATPVFLGSEGTEGRWQYDFARSERPDKWEFGVVLLKLGEEYLACGVVDKSSTLGESLP